MPADSLNRRDQTWHKPARQLCEFILARALSKGYPDKRAAFYPLMLSIVHDFTGYRIENAFYLNSFIYLLLLTAIYCVTVILCSPGKSKSALVPGAVISLLAVSSVPVMSRSATGGGFELLNALFVIVVLIAAIRYVREPGRSNLWILLLATFLLSQLRYESLAFVGFSALVVLITESRNRQRGPIPAILLFSLLLIPAVFQLNIIFSDLKWFEIKEPGLAPFGLAIFYKNIGAAVSYMFSTDRELLSNPVFYFTGIFSLIAVMVTLPRHKLFEDRPDYLVFMLWGATMVA